MKVTKLIRDLVLTCLVTAGLPAVAAQSGQPASGERPGRAAAHAALDARADLPAAPPALPTQASDRARGALSETAFGKKAAVAADAQAAQHAHDAVMDAHTAAASSAGQGSVVEAARAANAEVRAAATRARSTSTKSDAASHHGNSRSGPGRP